METPMPPPGRLRNAPALDPFSSSMPAHAAANRESRNRMAAANVRGARTARWIDPTIIHGTNDTRRGARLGQDPPPDNGIRAHCDIVGSLFREANPLRTPDATGLSGCGPTHYNTARTTRLALNAPGEQCAQR